MNILLYKCFSPSFISIGRRAARWERGRPPLPIFENWKKYPDFGKKGPNCIYLCVKFSIQNVVLRVSVRKTPNVLPAGSFFLVFLTKHLSKWSNYMKLFLLWNISGCASCQHVVSKGNSCFDFFALLLGIIHETILHLESFS